MTSTDKVASTLHDLHYAECDLTRILTATAERHQDDHEISHAGRDLAEWSQRHIRDLAATGREYGLDLDAEVTNPRHVSRLRGRAAGRLNDHQDPGLALLGDLRQIHATAAVVSLDWEVVGQSAQALQDLKLIELTQLCHPQTLRQLHWANATLKDRAVKIIAG